MISASVYLISCIGAGILGAVTIAMLAAFKIEDEREGAYRAGLKEGRRRERNELTSGGNRR
jgi:hypothetical protein